MRILDVFFFLKKTNIYPHENFQRRIPTKFHAFLIPIFFFSLFQRHHGLSVYVEFARFNSWQSKHPSSKALGPNGWLIVPKGSGIGAVPLDSHEKCI